MSDRHPKMIGYWFHPEESSYPHPQDFVRGNWLDARSLAALLLYLRSAPQFVAYRGLSWCRFSCGVDKRTMGNREFSDGLWVWPEGLAHYVEHHDVFLPDEFVSRAISGPPPSSLPASASQCSVDFEFWLTWARKHSANGHDRVV